MIRLGYDIKKSMFSFFQCIQIIASLCTLAVNWTSGKQNGEKWKFPLVVKTFSVPAPCSKSPLTSSLFIGVLRIRRDQSQRGNFTSATLFGFYRDGHSQTFSQLISTNSNYDLSHHFCNRLLTTFFRKSSSLFSMDETNNREEVMVILKLSLFGPPFIFCTFSGV